MYPVDINDFRILSSRSLSEYFPPDSGESLHFGNDGISRFSKDFERLLRGKRGLQGFSKAGSFRKWWGVNQNAHLTRPVMRTYTDAKLTMGELLDDLQMQFLASVEAERQGSPIISWMQGMMRNRVVLGVSLFVALGLERSGVFLWSLIILGPGVKMVNSYTDSVITPLAQTATQTGARDLGPVASRIQAWLTGREKLREVRSELKEVTNELHKTDFSKLSPAQAKARWAKFEETYFSLFLRYNQTLPSHLRDGRGVLRDLMIFTPVGLAGNLSTFDTQYWVHQREWTNAPVGSSKRLLHRREMLASEERIAGALAAWKMFEFMYPEVTRQPSNQASVHGLENSYQVFARSMRFDTYVQQFSRQMESVLKQMEVDFMTQDALARL